MLRVAATALAFLAFTTTAAACVQESDARPQAPAAGTVVTVVQRYDAPSVPALLPEGNTDGGHFPIVVSRTDGREVVLVESHVTERVQVTPLRSTAYQLGEVSAFDESGARLWGPIRLTERFRRGYACHEIVPTGLDRFIDVRCDAPDSSGGTRPSEWGLALRAIDGGRDLGEVRAPEGAIRRVCVEPTRGAVAWVERDDPTASALVDLSTGAASPSPAPSWCAAPLPDACRVFRREREDGAGWSGIAYRAWPTRPLRASCDAPSGVRAVPGFAPHYVLRDGHDEVAIGVRTEGRRVAMAVGMDPAKGTPSWRVVLPTRFVESTHEGAPIMADVSGGRLYVEYDAWLEHRLAAIDAASGARVWDVALPAWSTIAVGARRVYALTADFKLVTVDAASGAVLAQVDASSMGSR